MSDISKIQSLFDEYLSQHFFQQEPKELYDPINYILQLGGKRLRPLLALMGYQVFDSNIEKALPVAFAVEIFHNFSLVHDDIMDEAPLRRGKPTVHHQYNINTGILSGDVMLIYAYEYLLKTDNPSIHAALIKVFNQVAIEVCEGQQMDMNFEQRKDVTLVEYLKMIELKTAALIGGALQLGALMAGGDAKDAAQLASFGRNAGIAFQLQDDLLDAFGDPDKVGKKVGGDIVQNKKTYLIIKALEVADASTKEALRQWLASKPKDEQSKINQVKTILLELGIPELITQAKTAFLQEAKTCLESVNGIAAEKQALLELAEKLANREF
ncbi:MAG: polyprenyl synthetase family protein [Saprospiraceae bacterium]|nr:polyprenyl synthetase family protein [Saprospiraceae bacterium]